VTQPDSAQSYLIAAQIASMVHHFDQARTLLAQAQLRDADPERVLRQQLSLDQATGDNWPQALAARKVFAQQSQSIQDLVPLGALLADMGHYQEAEQAYLQAITQYRDLSPFALAWVCFQLGVLFGETIPEPDTARAAYWYQQAIHYLPAYTHARVHLSEIHLQASELHLAEALLLPIIESEDPEVSWRLAQIYAKQGHACQAQQQVTRTRETYENLLEHHTLAFADHAVDFYLEEGDDPAKALSLALLNLDNRTTLRAFELAHEAAVASEHLTLAAELHARATLQWGHLPAFKNSPLSCDTRTPLL
jgi:tetratricopeptide (TPR) repeat protein